MDKERIDKALDTLINMSTEQFEDVSLKIQIREQREQDKLALDSGIERLSLFLTDGGMILLVKPNEVMNFWLVNLFASGTFNYSGDDIEFVATEVPGELYRLTMKFGQLNYFVDLKDKGQLEDACLFLDIEVENPTAG